jgi:hypothetical protein
VDALEAAYKDYSEVSDVDNKWSTPLSEEELQTTKDTRQALYRSFIERKPGNWSNKWLGKVYGCHEDTIKNDDAALGVTSEPDYERVRVFWSNVNDIPVTDDHQVTGFNDEKRMGWFLVDLQEQKRYPALKPIAVKLLKQKRWIALYRQKCNLKYIGQKPVRTFDVIKQAHQRELPNMPAPEPKSASTWRKHSTDHIAATIQPHSQVDDTPQNEPQSVTERTPQPVSRWSKLARRFDENYTSTDEIEERLKTVIRDDSLHRIQKRTRCKRIIWANWKDEFVREKMLDWCKREMSLHRKRKRAQRAIDEASQTKAQRQAESIKQRVNGLNPKEPRLHMSSATALRLVEQYGYPTVSHEIDRMQRRDGIRNPVGWLCVVLRSNKKAKEIQEIYR